MWRWLRHPPYCQRTERNSLGQLHLDYHLSHILSVRELIAVPYTYVIRLALYVMFHLLDCCIPLVARPLRESRLACSTRSAVRALIILRLHVYSLSCVRNRKTHEMLLCTEYWRVCGYDPTCSQSPTAGRMNSRKCCCANVLAHIWLYSTPCEIVGKYGKV